MCGIKQMVDAIPLCDVLTLLGCIAMQLGAMVFQHYMGWDTDEWSG